jgi:hypothetical protein
MYEVDGVTIRRIIDGWLEAHPGTPLDPRTVTNTFPSIDVLALVEALEDMIRDHKLRTVWRLVLPDGSLAPDEFTDINQIPRFLNNAKVLATYFAAH